MDNGNNRFHDVVEPGKTPASPTSKPVITGSGPMARDPMFQRPSPAIDDRIKAVSSRAKTIEPPQGSTIQPADQPSHVDNVQPSAPAEQPTKDEPAKTEPPKTELNDQQSEAIKKLVEEKTYFLPVSGTTKQRGNLKTIIILVMLVVVTVAAFMVVKSKLF